MRGLRSRFLSLAPALLLSWAWSVGLLADPASVPPPIDRGCTLDARGTVSGVAGTERPRVLGTTAQLSVGSGDEGGPREREGPDHKPVAGCSPAVARASAASLGPRAARLFGLVGSPANAPPGVVIG